MNITQGNLFKPIYPTNSVEKQTYIRSDIKTSFYNLA